jgi:hypothetical protein
LGGGALLSLPKAIGPGFIAGPYIVGFSFKVRPKTFSIGANNVGSSCPAVLNNVGTDKTLQKKAGCGYLARPTDLVAVQPYARKLLFVL